MSYHYPHHVGTFDAPRRATSERIAQLVSRYPGISEREAKEIVSFMRTGRHLDIGRLTMDESIRPKLDAFMNEHRAEFRLKWWETTLVTGSIAAALVAFWLLYELLA